jgi:serine/threonine protein kinase, bacterial
MTWCFACGAACESVRCAECGTDLEAAPQRLRAELASRRLNEREVTLLLADLLSLLGIIHARGAVHGALSPDTVGRRRAGQGVLLLQGAEPAREWTAPEGAGAPPADLFSAGLVAVWALSRRSPAELVDRTGSLRWEKVLSAHPDLMKVLHMLLDPAPARRPKEPALLSDRLREIALGAASTFVPTQEAKDTVDDPSTMLPAQLEALDLEPTMKVQR